MLVAVALRMGLVVDFLHAHPGARTVQGDALAYWSLAGEWAAGRWVAAEPFHSAPLYSGFLAVVRWLGGGVVSVYVLQVALHLLTAFLLGRWTTRKLDDRAGLLAAATFLLLMEPAFYVTRILPTTLQLLTVILVLSLADRGAERRTAGSFTACGAALAALALVYPTVLGLIPLLPLWIVGMEARAAARDSRSGEFALWFDAAWEKAMLSTLCAALVILPATLHNWAAAGELIPITAHGGITLAQGNSPLSDGIYTPIPGVSQSRDRMHADVRALYEQTTGRAGTYAEVDRYFRRQALEFLTANPARAAWLVGRKAYWFLTGRHYSDIDYPTLEQRDGWLRLLMLSPLPTAWLMGPALLGLFVASRVARVNLWDYLLFLLPWATVGLFWYSPRYRAPAIPILVFFGVTALRQAMIAGANRQQGVGRRHNPVPPRLILPGLLLFLSVSTGLLNSITGFDRAEAYRPQYEFNRAQTLIAVQQVDAAIPHLETADRLDPDRPHVLAALADLYARAGRTEQAEQVVTRLVGVEPRAPESWLVLGGLYLRRQQWSAARDAFGHALELSPRSASSHLGLALALANDPAFLAQAESHFRAALTLDPENSAVICAFARWLVDHRRLEEAQPLIQKCLHKVPANHELTRGLHVSAPQPPSIHARIADLRARIDAAPQSSHLYSELAGELYAQGRIQEAIDTLRHGAASCSDGVTLSLELAWILATTAAAHFPEGSDAPALRREALRHARRVLDEMPDAGPQAWDVLAAAHASAGQYPQAVEAARRAYNAAVAENNVSLAQHIAERIKLYQSARPYVRD